MKRIIKNFIKLIFIFITILIILISSLRAYRNYDIYKNKKDIIKLVQNNLEFLNEYVQNKNYHKIYDLEEVKDIRKWPLDKDEVFIDFLHNGYGIASNTTYIGFYYVSQDKPTGYQGYPDKLIQKGKGWEWKEINGDNWYYTEKIVDHWYYYEAGF